MKRLRTSDIKRAADALTNVPTPEDVEVSTLAAVRILAPRIARMRKQGHPMSAVVQTLAASGVEISLSTLKRYLLLIKAEDSDKPVRPDEATRKPRRKPRRNDEDRPASGSRDELSHRSVIGKQPDVTRATFVPREDSDEI